MKTCSKCKLEKSIDNFYKDPSLPNGYKSACKACVAAYKRLCRRSDERTKPQPEPERAELRAWEMLDPARVDANYWRDRIEVRE